MGNRLYNYCSCWDDPPKIPLAFRLRCQLRPPHRTSHTSHLMSSCCLACLSLSQPGHASFNPILPTILLPGVVFFEFRICIFYLRVCTLIFGLRAYLYLYLFSASASCARTNASTEPGLVWEDWQLGCQNKSAISPLHKNVFPILHKKLRLSLSYSHI